MSDPPRPLAGTPSRPFPFRAVIVLTAVVVSCAIFSNLSFLITKRENYRFFPPFLPSVNSNMTRNLGGEYFHIAKALAAGKGFADPFQEPTGPTAWMPPVLPTLMAGILRLSDGDRDCVVAVLVCLHVFALVGTGVLVLAMVAQTTQRVGAGLATFVFLLAMLCQFRQCFQRAHDFWLVLLTIDLLIVGCCWWRPLHAPTRVRADRHSPLRPVPAPQKRSAKDSRAGLWPAAGWGLFGGLCALCSPIVGFTWVVWSFFLGLQQRAWSRLALTALVAGLTLAPWTVRNYLVLGHFIPVKSNLIYELYQSQCLQEDGLLQNTTIRLHPTSSRSQERQEYRALGETDYLKRKGEQFWQAVWADPGDYLDRVAERFLGATLWYVPYERTTEAKQPWLIWWSRLTHPLPFLALLVLLFSAGRERLSNPQITVIGVYLLYLLPYVLVSYYDRYAGPLLVVKVLLVLWAIDRGISLVSSTRQ